MAMLGAHNAASVMVSTERFERQVETRLETRLQVPPTRRAPADEGTAQTTPVAPTEPDRKIVPTESLDVQVPAAKDRRPALVVLWLGDEEHVPPRETLTPAPPITLYAEQVGAFYRRVMHRFVD